MKKILLFLIVFCVTAGFTVYYQANLPAKAEPEFRIPAPPVMRFSQVTEPNEIAQFLTISSAELKASVGKESTN